MKDIMMETAQDICGMTKQKAHADTRKRGGGTRRLLKAVTDKKIKYGKWKKETRKRQGWSIRREEKMRRELSLQQRKRNRRNGQTT